MVTGGREIYQFSANRLDGTPQSLADYAGMAVLIVNTASLCGFTPQYEGLQKLYQTYRERGLVVLGFPCNQFGGQEPGTREEIGQFCSSNYGVSFPMFEPIDVNGLNAHPLFEFLKSSKPGLFGSRRIKWNFTKFLVERSGRVAARFAPRVKPESLAKPIELLLAAEDRA